MQVEISTVAMAWLLMCVAPTPAAKEPKRAADEQLGATLGALEKQSWVAWKARDAHFFQTFLSSDHVEIGPGGLADKAMVVASVGSPTCTVTSYSIGDFKFTRLSADTAVLNYRAEQQTTCGGVAVPSPAWATSVYVKRDGKMAQRHLSADSGKRALGNRMEGQVSRWQRFTSVGRDSNGLR